MYGRRLADEQRSQIQNRSDLNRSGKAKPETRGLGFFGFWFDLIRYGLQALAGRRHRRTTGRD
jgi:hypothetical protein